MVEIFCTLPEQLWRTPSFLYSGNRDFYEGKKCGDLELRGMRYRGMEKVT
jgi:hypothetical protein